MDPTDRKLPAALIRPLVAGIGLLASAGALLYGCAGGESGSVPTAALVGCPEHAIAIDTGFGGTVTDVPVASGIDDVPEFHDCQRLLVDGQYGPLAAIWIAQAADTLFVPPAYREGSPAPMGGTADMTEAPVATPEALEDEQDAGLGFAVAEIYNWDAKPYEPLAIQPGFSCLYLWRAPTAPTNWEARMIPLGKNPAPCLEPVSVARLKAGPGTPLLVRPVSFPGMRADDVPPVARWDREPMADGNHYIGLKCGIQWCEIGSMAANAAGLGGGSDFTPSSAAAASVEAQVLPGLEEMPTALALGAAPPSMRDRVFAVKGWYDQQELALFQDGKLVRSGVVGTIIPHPGLDLLDGTGPLSDAFGKRWIPAAYIHVDGDYDGKLLQLQRGVNRSWICRGTAADCHVDPLPSCASTMSPSAEAWWSKLELARDRTVRFRCIVQDDKPGVIPAGAARWRWLETDETTWVRCSTGCCTSN